MTIRQITATGIEALHLATAVLQRSRLADPLTGVFEAADIQWSWRTPRISDDAEKVFWVDEQGPIAGILLTSNNEHSWQIDPVIIPNEEAINAATVWEHTLAIIEQNPEITFDVPISNDDEYCSELANQAGLIPTDQDSTGWLNASDKPDVVTLKDGFKLVDRTMQMGSPHPMIDRNGKQIEERLNQCSLYDPALDLAVETCDGTDAGYSLCWFDPVTRVGLIEPVRVHDEFQRQGLARAMLTRGINCLAQRGAERIKVSWQTPAAGALYLGVGFRQTSTTTWYSTPSF